MTRGFAMAKMANVTELFAVMVASLLMVAGHGEAFGQTAADADTSGWIVLRSDGSVLSEGVDANSFSPYLRSQAPLQSNKVGKAGAPPLSSDLLQSHIIVVRPPGSNAVLTAPTDRLLNDLPVDRRANEEISALNRALIYEWFLDNADRLNANNGDVLFFLNLNDRKSVKSRAEIEIDRANYLRLLDRLDRLDNKNILIVPNLP